MSCGDRQPLNNWKVKCIVATCFKFCKGNHYLSSHHQDGYDVTIRGCTWGRRFWTHFSPPEMVQLRGENDIAWRCCGQFFCMTYWQLAEEEREVAQRTIFGLSCATWKGHLVLSCPLFHICHTFFSFLPNTFWLQWKKNWQMKIATC